MGNVDLIKLSKTVAHALRHEPQAYDISLDDEGWIALSDLVIALNFKGINVTTEVILQMVGQSEKKRYQILDNRIRAYYGHSIENKIVKQYQIPPELLYHGTVKSNVGGIMEKGILPMDRQYVHLSVDKDTAEIVAKRRKGDVVIFKINALMAHNENIHFYEEENGIWLSEYVPTKYIYL